MIRCVADLSALSPETINPSRVGFVPALENLAAFLLADCVTRGELSRDDAAHSFDRLTEELDAMRQPMSEG